MKKVEEEIKQFLEERNWTNLVPADLAKSISIEAGELLELFQWGSPTVLELKKDKTKMKALEHELADVLIYAFDFSIMLGLDTEKIIRKKLTHNRKKFPVKLMKKGSEHYYRVKKEYREKKK